VDILLVSSIDVLWPEPDKVPFMGLFVLRDILKDHYEVEYVDFKLIEEVVKALTQLNCDEAMRYLASYLVAKRPKVIGFYTVCNTFVFTVQVAAHIRELDPTIKIVFGGPHATLTAMSCLEHLDFLDAVYLGEAEHSIIPLMDALIAGGDLSKVAGAAYRSGGEIHINAQAELLTDEELIDSTVYDYTPFSSEAIEKNAYLEGGRGCPFGCTFCSTNSFWGRKYRLKPIEALIDEMDRIHEIYGTNDFSILHDHFTTDKRRIKEFCRLLIANDRGYFWSCSGRADSFDDELLDLLKEANCKSIYLGIETGSGRMQRVINKNLDIENSLTTIRKIYDRGIDATVSFIYGFPDETETDFFETIKMIEEVYRIGFRYVQLHPYILTPQTEETDKVKDVFYFDRDATLEHTIYNKNLFSDQSVELIEHYPDLFEQYYTFDTPVRAAYPQMSTLLHLLVYLTPYCKNSIAHLLEVQGMIELYRRHEGLLEGLRLDIDKIAAIDRENMSDLALSFRVFDTILREEERDLDDLRFSQLALYERCLVEYVLSENKNPVVHEFDVDLEELLKTGTLIEQKCNVVYFSRAGRVRATKTSALAGMLDW